MEELEGMMVAHWRHHHKLIADLAALAPGPDRTLRYRSYFRGTITDGTADGRQARDASGGGAWLAVPAAPLPGERISPLLFHFARTQEAAGEGIAGLPVDGRMLEWLFEWMFIDDGPHGCLAACLTRTGRCDGSSSDDASSSDVVRDAGGASGEGHGDDDDDQQRRSVDEIKRQLVLLLGPRVIDEMYSVHRDLAFWMQLASRRPDDNSDDAGKGTTYSGAEVTVKQWRMVRQGFAELRLGPNRILRAQQHEVSERIIRLSTAILTTLSHLHNESERERSGALPSPSMAIDMLELQLHALALLASLRTHVIAVRRKSRRALTSQRLADTDAQPSIYRITHEVLHHHHHKAVAVGIRHYAKLRQALKGDQQLLCQRRILELHRLGDPEHRRQIVECTFDSFYNSDMVTKEFVDMLVGDPEPSIRRLAWETVCSKMGMGGMLSVSAAAFIRCLEQEKDLQVMLAAVPGLFVMTHDETIEHQNRMILGLIKRIEKISKPTRSLLKLVILFIAEHRSESGQEVISLPDELQLQVADAARLLQLKRSCIDILRKLARYSLHAARVMLAQAQQLCSSSDGEHASSTRLGVLLLEIVATSSVDSCRVWLKRNDVASFLPILLAHMRCGTDLHTTSQAIRALTELRLIEQFGIPGGQ